MLAWQGAGMLFARSLACVLVACATCALAASAPLAPHAAALRERGDAARPDPWRAAADRFFKVVARDEAIPDAGLPRAVAQDGDGFVWLATDAGLARWDGTGFKSYTTEATADAGALPEVMVNLLFADAAGRLWLGMSAEGLLWHDPVTERFVRPPNRTPLDATHVTAIDDDGAGGLWVASDIGLAHVRGADRRVTLIAPDAANNVPNGPIRALHRDTRGALWIAADHRLFVRRTGASRFVPVALPGAGAIADLLDDARGNLWVSTSNGFYTVDAGGAVRHLPVGERERPPVLGAMIRAGDGTIWTASRTGIWIVDPATSRIRHLRHDPLIASSLPEDGLNQLIRDAAGRVWVVGDATLAYVDPAPRRVLGLVGALRPAPGALPDQAWAVGAAPDGTLWYGAADVPAARLAPSAGGIAPPQRLPGARRDVHAFAFPPGRGAFTAGDDGLFHLSLAGTDARRLSAEPWSRLLLDGDRLYVGGTGVGVVDVRRPGAPARAAWSARLTDPRVRSFAVTGDGSLWVGTARGLNRVDPRTGTVEQFRPRTRAGAALRGNYVSTLLTDRQGRLWAGTVGGGLTVFERHGAAWRSIAHLGRREGLPHDTVDKLLAGPDGAIWASTDGGIARIDPATRAITLLKPADGVAFTANWTGAGDILPDGRLVFAGFGGLTIIDPALPATTPWQAPLRFTAIRGGGRSIPAQQATTLTIGSDERSLTAEFARLDYATGRDQAFAYRLEPQESEWTRVDAQHRIARYTNLPPGRSTLVVRALEGSGASGDRLRPIGAPLTLTLDVEHRWSETPIVRAAVVAGVLAATLGLVHLRLRSARRRERLLETLVERRTAELLVSRSELEKLAYSDTLTGLGNRRLYGEVLARLVAAASASSPFALLLIDLDRFKQVNDGFGHDVGDALLVEVADRLTTTVRQRDSIFRLGGDEFAILIADARDDQGVADLCRRLQAACAPPVTIDRRTLHPALSIGAVVARDGATTAEALYKAADLALYEAKRAGRGTWRLAPTAAG
ncbi:diguanylate cyclase domain-containing protein [Sphingomonas sp. CLY1604]|uniref:diguanylate cyclase domain-containing protein n=1 Tax=Sphingomonas sp. CLY1604 TaxID=3457786 RepID=UPI003FD82573